MAEKNLIQKLTLTNFLSFGSQSEEIELQALNVLIGSNSSGKSNFIEALGILKAMPTNLATPFRKGGGINDFLWKGEKDIPDAKIRVVLKNRPTNSLAHEIHFTAINGKLELRKETIERGKGSKKLIYKYVAGEAPLLRISKNQAKGSRLLRLRRFTPNQSILSQRKDPDQYPELSYLGDKFSNIALYGNLHLGQGSELRKAQQSDLPEHPLLEDGSNLGLMLNNLQHQLGSRQLIERFNTFYGDEAEELSIRIYAGAVQIFVREKSMVQPLPATRLSDGTLHYLFLMALLLDPNPPLLLCIEEPEVGLHPDILPAVAEMLVEASQRTQLIVTTHSDALISALSPEAVLVCERDESGSRLCRLDPGKLKNWLKEYALGDLWRMGEIGGNRW
ncbi:MAG: AAA family ATPase [Gammaproteobacteria bacterium]|nr:AAA family ATPase [Gammaproteobacteria bacterium]